jgi:hypothetical protein
MHRRSVAAVAAAALSGLLASGCVIVPVTIEGYDPDCRVVTRHMELKAVQVAAFNACSGQGCDAAVLAAFGVTAVSAVVSGSIVVMGNVVYWAEHRADCPAPPPAAT